MALSVQNAGELVDFVRAAVQEHKATPATRVVVRIGAFGQEYVVEQVKMAQDRRGLTIILQTAVLPVQ